MSVLVKGMKMPETCIECPMQFGGFCYVQPPAIDEARVFPTVDECWEKKKPEWCPLVEVEDGIHTKKVAQDLINATEKAYDEMLRMFGELEETENANGD